MITEWITFLLASLGIVIAGIKLASFGEALGEKCGIGQGCIGLLFLATITSIPELTTTVTGASINAPNIAIGNALGSNLFNVALIAIMDILLIKRGPFLLKVRSYHVASGGIVILLTSLVLLGMILSPQTTVLGISPLSFLILFGYLFGVFFLYRVEKREAPREVPPAKTMPLSRALIGFFLCAAIIVAAGIFLTRASKAISLQTALSGPFMGAILVAIVTSLPELSTSIGALRIGAHDMIIGNLFGSNMFNILTIFIADAAFRRGGILTSLGAGTSDQLTVLAFSLILTAIAVIAIGYRSRRRVLGVGADAVILLGTYLVGIGFIISHGINV